MNSLTKASLIKSLAQGVKNRVTNPTSAGVGKLLFMHNVIEKLDSVYVACEINDIDIGIDGIKHDKASLSFEYEYSGITWNEDGTAHWSGVYEPTVGEYEDNILFVGRDGESEQILDEDTDKEIVKSVMNQVFAEIGKKGQDVLANHVICDVCSTELPVTY
ncbi:MAG: hypothetical protein ACTIJH_11885 [Moraxellaceae bacterium]